MRPRLFSLLLLQQIAMAGSAMPQTLTMALPSGDLTPFVGGANFVGENFDARLEGSLSLNIVELDSEDYFANGMTYLREGKFDIVLVALAQLVDQRLSVLKLFELPFLFQNLREVRDVQDSDLGKMLLSGLSDPEIRALAYWNAGMTQLFSTTPIASADDLKGLKLRSAGSDLVDTTLTGFGIAPVRLGPSALSDALSQGEVMAAEMTPGAVASGVIALPTTNILTMPFRPDVRVVLASRKTWDILNYQDQARLSGLLQDAAAEVDKLAEADQERGVSELNTERNFALVTPSEDERNNLLEAAEDVWSGEEDLANLGIVAPVLMRLEGLRSSNGRSPIDLPASQPNCCEVIFATNRERIGDFAPWCQFTAVRGSIVVGKVVLNTSDQAAGRCEGSQVQQYPIPQILGGLDELLGLLDGYTDILIYVHGYRVSFEEAVFDAARFARILNYDGAVMAFSWSTEGIQPDEVPMYCSAFVTAMVSAGDFGHLLMKIAGNHDVDIVAHSMGTVVATRGLQGAADRVRNFVAIAGDEERDVFENTLKSLGRVVPGRISVYASSMDNVLGLGRLYGSSCRPPHEGSRIGQARGDLVDLSPADAIDATIASNESFESHSYQWKSPTLHEDFVQLLIDNTDAVGRQHIKAEDPRPSRRITDYLWLQK